MEAPLGFSFHERYVRRVARFIGSGRSRYNPQNSLVPDDFIHRSGLTGGVFGARFGDYAIEPTCFHILLKFLVPQPVEMFAKFLRQLPCLLWRKLSDRFADLSHRAHKEKCMLRRKC